MRYLAGLAIAAIFFSAVLSSRAQSSTAPPQQDPHALVSEVVQNELNSQNNDNSLWTYSETRKQKGKTESFRVVETKDGEVDELVAVNGQPLTGKAKEKEDRRIHKLLANPADIRNQHQSESSDANEERKLMKMLPDAFIYGYAGKQGDEIKLSFRPNPKFHVPDREGHVFHHMQGEMLVDGKEKRLKELSGRLMSPVKFGDGILGHLDQGGTFSVKQKDVGGGHWEMTYLDVHMDGKALFFKTIAVLETETDSDFRRVPDGTTADRAGQFLEVRRSS